MSYSPSFGLKSLALASALLVPFTATSFGSLVAYYTLDDLGAGVSNLGTDGATSDLSPPSAAATPTVIPGLIGDGALGFDGNDILRTIITGNAGDDIIAYGFTMSIWISSVTLDTSRDTVMTISDRAAGDKYYGVGVQTVGTAPNQVAQPELVRRNGNFTELDATGTVNANGADWINVVAIFGTSGAELYVGGKLSNTANGAPTFVTTLDTLSVGGFLRNGSTTTPTDPFFGNADDIGLWDNALVASDVALINGLGLLGGIGLDQIDEAQALNSMATGATGVIGGFQWQKVTGLSGTTGDFGGSFAGQNAFIVTAPDGSGIQLIPEPGSATLLLGAAVGLLGWRRRSTAA
jgi:hypothetical protein